MAQAGHDLVLHIDPDISIIPVGSHGTCLLDHQLAAAPFLGEVIWDQGQVRRVRGTIRFSRSGHRRSAGGSRDRARPGSGGGGSGLPRVGDHPPGSLSGSARAIARIDRQRWSIETAFETMHAWGQDAFMVRSRRAFERLLWVVAIAYLLTIPSDANTTEL